MKANYQLLIDNGLDLSHLQFLHKNNLGSDKIAREDAECVQKGNTIWSHRLTYDEEVIPFFAQAKGKLVDRRFSVRWDPPGLLEAYYEKSEAGNRSNVLTAAKSAIFSIPETETTAHFFFAVSMPIKIGEAGCQKLAQMAEALMYPFAKEDVPILEDQQKIIGDKDFMSMCPMLLPIDEASIRCHRVMERLLAEEASALKAQ